jgi:hypothetical protein
MFTAIFSALAKLPFSAAIFRPVNLAVLKNITMRMGFSCQQLKKLSKSLVQK